MTEANAAPAESTEECVAPKKGKRKVNGKCVPTLNSAPAPTVNVAQLTQALNNVFNVLGTLRVEGTQAHILVEARQTIGLVNNELVKVQNALASGVEQ